MSRIWVIDALATTAMGPTTRGPQRDWNEVFLAQGAADGACGLYAIFMALIICGVVDREELTGLSPDRRTRAGKLQGLIMNLFPGLVKDGSHMPKLAGLVEATFGKQLSVRYSGSRGSPAANFVATHVQESHPVVLGLRFEGGAHAVVAVGAAWDAKHEHKAPDHLILLDPSQAPPSLCVWNNVVILKSTGGRYPYRLVAEPYRVQLSEALAMWPQG
jgi:hypothetical protein